MRRFMQCFVVLVLCLFFVHLSHANDNFFHRINEGEPRTVKEVLQRYSYEGCIPVFQYVRKDERGNIHAKYRFRKGGVYLEHASLTIHMNKNEQVFLVNGTELKGRTDESNQKLVSSSEIQKSIRSALNGHSFSIFDLDCRSFKPDRDINCKDFSQLVYFSTDASGDLNTKQLAYKIDVFPEGHQRSIRLYISARDGRVLYKSHNCQHICEDISVNTNYYGAQTITVDNDGNGTNILFDECRGIETYIDDGINAPFVPSSTNTFSSPTVEELGALSAHYGVSVAYDYFVATFGWQGFGGSGGVIPNYYILGMDNAYFDPAMMGVAFGDGQGMGPFTSPITGLDIAGHEFAHGIINQNGALFYGQEPGAINESYADIFGLAVEQFGSGGFNWLISDESAPGGIRSFSEPNSLGQPDCYNGPFYQNTSNGNPTDEFGVHTNSGVMNYWFYLLNVGGSGGNCFANPYAYDVLPAIDLAQGQGYSTSFDLMTDLLFTALINGYVGLNTEFTDMREITIEVAHDMGFSCAFRENLKEAWIAVGVGDEPDGCDIHPNMSVSLPNIPCPGEEIPFFVTPDDDVTYDYEWEFGDGQSSTVGAIVTHVYDDPGTYVVTVTLTDNSLPSGPVSAFDQVTVTILPDCNPNTNNDCSVNAGNPQNICFGVDVLELDAPVSSAYANPPNIEWTLIATPSNVNFNDVEISDITSYDPTVSFLGGSQFPIGEYIFEMCVDCAASGGNPPVRKCSQSAMITILEPPSTPEILTDDFILACNEIIIPIVEPNINELGDDMELDINISPSDFVNAEYIPGEGIRVWRYAPGRTTTRYWSNYPNTLHSISYYLENNRCILESNVIEADFINTQYNYDDGLVDYRILNYNNACSGPKKRLDGSRPGQGIPLWEVISVPPGSTISPGDLSTGLTNGDAILTLDVEGTYQFKYSVTDPTGTCPYSERMVSFIYEELLVDPVELIWEYEVICESLDEETIFQMNQPAMDDVAYQWVVYAPSLSVIEEGSVEIDNPYQPNTFVTFYPGVNGTVEFANAYFAFQIQARQYFLDLECSTEFLELIDLPDISYEDNTVNVHQHIENFALNYILDNNLASECLNGATQNIELDYNQWTDEFTLFIDGEEVECENLPCVSECYTSRLWRFYQGNTLEVEENINFFCENPGGTLHIVELDDYIINSNLGVVPGFYTEINVIAFDVPSGVNLPSPLEVNSPITLSEYGTYSFTIQYQVFEEGIGLVCEDIETITIGVQPPFVPFAGEDQYVCPNTIVYLNGAPTFDQIGMAGEWSQVGCGNSCDALIVDPNDANTVVLIPSIGCNEEYIFEWEFETDADCDPISDQTSVFVLDEDDGCECGGCSEPYTEGIELAWFDQSNNIISFEIEYFLPATQGQVTPLFSFINFLSQTINYNIQGNVVTVSGTVQFSPDQEEMCYGIDYQNPDICNDAFCGDICTISNGEVCPEPCTINLETRRLSFTCETDSLGTLYYSFGFYIDGGVSMIDPITITSPDGIVSNVVLTPFSPGVTWVTGWLYAPNDPDDIGCLNIEFGNDDICPLEEICSKLPHCDCVVSNENPQYPECVDPGEEFCFLYEFDYYGNIPASFSFTMNTGSDYTLISAINTNTGNSSIQIGHNIFELCLVYKGDCSEGATILEISGDVLQKIKQTTNSPTSSIPVGTWTSPIPTGPIGGGKPKPTPQPIPTESVECSVNLSTSIPCCDECEKLDAKLQHLGCAADSEGNLVYTFNIKLWDTQGVGSNFGVSSTQGTIQNLEIIPGIDPQIPELTQITGIFVPNSSANDICLEIEFDNPNLCRIELCEDLPECECAISNTEIIMYDECVEEGQEFCIKYRFDYYGPQDLEIEFFLDQVNSSSGYVLTSAVSTINGGTEVLLGHNIFEICFVLKEECTDTTHIFFDAIIPGIDCKIWEMFDLPCCEEECTEKLDIVLQSLDCAADSEGNLVYTFDIRIWDPEGIGSDVLVSSLQGVVSDVQINPGFMPDLPPLTQITGIISPYLNETYACFELDFEHPTLCNLEVCDKLPECECAISNNTISMGIDCIEEGQPFCIEYEFDYYGPQGLMADFFLDEVNSTYGYSMTSAVNAATGNTEILLGHNTFKICFVFEKECTDTTHVFFDAIIPGIDCKIWEMFDLPCCEDECTNLAVMNKQIGCSKTVPNGYDLLIIIDDPNQLGNNFDIIYNGGGASGTNSIYDGNSLVISSTLTPSGPSTDMCITIDFADPLICDQEICIPQPDCSCNAVHNINIEYPANCIGVGSEFCVSITMEHAGFNTMAVNAVLDVTNSSPDYTMTSFTGTEIMPGSNSFEACFIYSGDCIGGTTNSADTDLVFDLITNNGCYFNFTGVVGCCFSKQSTDGFPSKILEVEPQIEVRPNPFTDVFSLEIAAPNTYNAQIEIYDMLGRKLYDVQKNIQEGNHKMIIQPELKFEGLYWVRVLDIDTQKSQTFSILKVR